MIKRTLLAKILPVVVVLGFTLLAAWPLFQKGFIPTHDGEYHLVRFFEFEKMLRVGYWFPRWAPGLNSGYGVPLFNFNYPLPNYFGVFYHVLGFSLADSFKLTLATGYSTAVVFCFIWLSKLFSKQIAGAASIVFAFVPYWFVDIYVRGSVGEVLAVAWLMLALASIERNWTLFFIFAVAGLILSHNILALIFLPILIVYLALRKPKYLWYLVISLGLSAYFWIPALAEQSYVVGLNTVNYQDHFAELWQLLVPSWGTGFSGSADFGNQMSFQIGIIPLFILFWGIIPVSKEKIKKDKVLALFFILLAVGSALLTLGFSEPIWKLIPFIAFIQYPWRFLSVLLPTTAFFAAYVFHRMKKAWFIGGITFLAVASAYSYTRPAVYPPRDDNYYFNKPNFTDGTSSLGNAFSSRWSSWKQTRPENKVEFITGNGGVSLMEEQFLKYEFTAEALGQSSIRVNTLYYPGWGVTVDGVRQPIDYERDGTITFTIPTGWHRIRVLFSETPVRLTSDFVSVLSLFCLSGWIILKRYLWR